eukprot:scaffold94169_cov62-Attheya_sp.AAC.2
MGSYRYWYVYYLNTRDIRINFVGSAGGPIGEGADEDGSNGCLNEPRLTILGNMCYGGTLQSHRLWPQQISNHSSRSYFLLRSPPPTAHLRFPITACVSRCYTAMMDNNNVRPDRQTKSVLKALRWRARKKAFREASAALVEPVSHGRTVDIPFARETTEGRLSFVEPVPHCQTVNIPFVHESTEEREPSDGLLPFVEPVLHGRTVVIPFVACKPPVDKPPFVEPVSFGPTVDIPFVRENQIHPPFVEPVGAELTAGIPFGGTLVVDDCFIEMDMFDSMDVDLNGLSSCDEFSLDENENSWTNGVILSDTVTPSKTKIKFKNPRQSP